LSLDLSLSTLSFARSSAVGGRALPVMVSHQKKKSGGRKMILDATEIFDRQKIQPLGCLKKKRKKKGNHLQRPFPFRRGHLSRH
jgi:hypothetical protein